MRERNALGVDFKIRFQTFVAGIRGSECLAAQNAYSNGTLWYHPLESRNKNLDST